MWVNWLVAPPNLWANRGCRVPKVRHKVRGKVPRCPTSAHHFQLMSRNDFPQNHGPVGPPCRAEMTGPISVLGVGAGSAPGQALPPMPPSFLKGFIRATAPAQSSGDVSGLGDDPFRSWGFKCLQGSGCKILFASQVQATKATAVSTSNGLQDLPPLKAQPTQEQREPGHDKGLGGSFLISFCVVLHKPFAFPTSPPSLSMLEAYQEPSHQSPHLCRVSVPT